jgi:hypothetical protein
MTETSGGLAYDGMPLPGAAFRIDEGHRAHRGDGADARRGYLGDDAATRERFVDGRHLTGDLGRVRDGVVEVVGRLDDVVQVGGVNVAVAAVEDVLLDVCDSLVLAGRRAVGCAAHGVRRAAGSRCGSGGCRRARRRWRRSSAGLPCRASGCGSTPYPCSPTASPTAPPALPPRRESTR